MLNDPISLFGQAAADAGLPIPGYPIADGELHRFKIDGDKEDNSWYVLHSDGVPAGAYGCWKRGIKENWCSKRTSDLSESERRQLSQKIEQAKAKREKDQARTAAAAKQRAGEIWEQSSKAESHPYLSRKQVGPHGVYRRGNGLVVPARDNEGVLHTLQFISADGEKRFMPGGRVSGCYHAIGKPNGRLLIAEGYATAASLYEATGYATAIAFNTANLKAVAKALREKFPNMQIILCADNDTQTDGNPGVRKATEAAQEIEGLLAIPNCEGDFNDIATDQGAEAVRAIIEAAKEPARSNEAILKEAVGLDNITYHQKSKVLAKELGIPKSVLDTERKKALKESVEDETQTLFLITPEPCADPVDGAELLNALVTIFNEYLVLPDGAAETLALFTIHTYCPDAAWISALMAVLSPTKECGKTTVMELLQSLTDKPLLASNCSTPTLFRGIEKYKPTFLIDEADTFLKDNIEMRGVLNSGHNRASAQVLRTVAVGDSYDVQPFSTWCPKAIAAIGKLPPTLMSRSIVIVMQRKKIADKIKRLRGDKLHEFESVRRQCVRWAADNFEAIKATDPAVPEYLGDRGQDNWRTLLAIAGVAGWTETTLTAIRQMTPKKVEDDDTGVELLADIRKIFGDRNCVSSAEIVGALNEMEERLWPGFYHGKGISPQGVAKILGRYGIKPKLHDTLGKKRGYERKQFLDVWVRYLPDPDDSPDSGVPLLQTSNDGACDDSLGVTNALGVTPGNGLEPPPNKGCNTGTPKRGVSGEKGEEMPDIAETQEDAFDDMQKLREMEDEYQDMPKDRRGSVEESLI